MSAARPIAVDAMGGDHGPRVPVEAALTAARGGHPVLLVGDEPKIRRVLGDLGGSLPRELSVVHTPEAIAMDEKPSAAVRKRPNNSISLACRLVAEGRASAALSAGNSGAVMAAGLFELGRIAGVQRPAIGSAFPTKREPAVVLDLGANIDPTPVQLAQFALLGEAYARAVLHRRRPRVALMTNGSEEVKGTELTRAAHEILGKADIDYAGYCEGRDLFEGELDVIVFDGFTGNVLLKTLEGFVRALRDILEKEVRGSITATAGALLMRNIFGAVKRKLDYEEAGGAPLLGLNQSCLVAHGGSSVNALVHAIGSAEKLSSTPLVETIAETMRRHAELGLFPLKGG